MRLSSLDGLRLNRFTLTLFLLLLLPSYASEEPATAQSSFRVVAAVDNDEASVLSLDYRVDCGPAPLFPGIAASLRFEGRELRFELFSQSHHLDLLLGGGIDAAIAETLPDRVRLVSNPECRLENLSARVRTIGTEVPTGSALSPEIARRIAVKNAPFLVIRPDQWSNRLTDLPLALAYSVIKTGRSTTALRYTLVFSDEDSQPTASDTEFQISRYGRRTDIEWIYEVELDRDLAVVARRYQGDILLGAGHSTRPFQGQFLPGTAHPVLYDVATHNVFGDEPLPAQAAFPEPVGYALVPSGEIPFPQARERIMFDRPWIFEVSDAELKREHRLAHPFSDYLYVEINGELSQGNITAVLELTGGRRFLSGNGIGDIDRLGEDLWHRQSFTGIPLEPTLLEDLGARAHGELYFERTSVLPPRLGVQNLHFYRFDAKAGPTRLIDISYLFDCAYDGMGTHCIF